MPAIAWLLASVPICYRRAVIYLIAYESVGSKSGTCPSQKIYKLGCKCVLDKSDAIVDLEHHLGLVLSNYTNSLT